MCVGRAGDHHSSRLFFSSRGLTYQFLVVFNHRVGGIPGEILWICSSLEAARNRNKMCGSRLFGKPDPSAFRMPSFRPVDKDCTSYWLPPDLRRTSISSPKLSPNPHGAPTWARVHIVIPQEDMLPTHVEYDVLRVQDPPFRRYCAARSRCSGDFTLRFEKDN